MTSQTLHSWHQISSIWQHIHSLGHHTTLCMTSSPLYLTSRPLYLCHHTHPIDDITANTWNVLHPVYLWHHIPYVSDKISTKYDITTLCVDVTTLRICVTSFVLQMTLHTIASITPHHSIYDVTSTSGMTSHTLYQTLHPLYLCHHKLSTDITTTFEWHHTYLLCGIICTIWNITSNPYVMTLLYLWHHNFYILNHICVLTPTV